MDEYQKKHNEILTARQKIVESLKGASKQLQEAGRECRIFSFWNLSSEAKEIDEIAEKIEKLAEELPFPAP